MSIEGWSQKIEALKADLTQLQDEAPFEHVDVPLADALREVIGVKTSGKKAPLGGSKLGGKAHAEPGFVWPTAPNQWQGDEIQPLALIAQLDLAELAPHDPAGRLPSEGRLLFFMLPIEYDPDAMKTHVHVARGDALVEHAPPRALRENGA
jgi:hypothetical protein